MRLGLFMMPIHNPARDYLDVFKEDRESILHAEELGYDEAWVGEHYACKTEPIPDPLQFMATLIPVTKRIKFGTAVLNLPQHHPAVVAGNAAQFDHLSEGRFIMGVGPGGLGSDFELFQTFEKNRAEMMAESIDMIHKIWASDPPYRLHGKYWDIVVDQQMQKHLGIGPMLKPYQKPYPPLAMSVMSPRSGTARFAGERGWGMISANFTPAPPPPAASPTGNSGGSPARSWWPIRTPRRATTSPTRTAAPPGIINISATISRPTSCSASSSPTPTCPTPSSPGKDASSSW